MLNLWAKLVEWLTWQASKSMENFPSSCWLGNRRPLLKECKTQHFGFHWTGLVVSTYITSIWKLKGDMETKAFYCTTWEQLLFQGCLFKWSRTLKSWESILFVSWKAGFLSQRPTEVIKLTELISKGSKRRKSSLILFTKFGSSWNWLFHLKISKGSKQNENQMGNKRKWVLYWNVGSSIICFSFEIV